MSLLTPVLHTVPLMMNIVAMISLKVISLSLSLPLCLSLSHSLSLVVCLSACVSVCLYCSLTISCSCVCKLYVCAMCTQKFTFNIHSIVCQ